MKLFLPIDIPSVVVFTVIIENAFPCRCPTGVRSDMIDIIFMLKTLCMSCHLCPTDKVWCPTGEVILEDGVFRVDQSLITQTSVASSIRLPLATHDPCRWFILILKADRRPSSLSQAVISTLWCSSWMHQPLSRITWFIYIDRWMDTEFSDIHKVHQFF